MSVSTNDGRLLAVHLEDTSVRTCLEPAAGRRLPVVRRPAAPMTPTTDPETAADLVGSAIDRACADAGVTADGLAGVCVAISTTWADQAEPLQRLLRSRYAGPVSVRLDSHLAALAEAERGRGRNLSRFLMVSNDALRTVTLVQQGRPLPGALGLNAAMVPRLFRDVASRTAIEPHHGSRSPWAAMALLIAPPLIAAYLITGSSTIIVSRTLVASGWRHFVDHLISRIGDVAPASRPDISRSAGISDPVLRGALLCARAEAQDS